ncbi:cytochrome P450 [Novosphingobium sp. TH158]|uniref:cytochrome P450 n=1 Tax=Novosphingobium sp. TH158 TaxID=2067455 RepID=UPI000C7D0EBB|nr:cytochrome P450 [Novosphingobium sp. TH158]PLK27488.1 cytochrome P450 [Novosphingobium sp. TH158]
MTDLTSADVFTDNAVAQKPFDYFEALRAKGPIVPLGFRNVVAVTGYDEGVAIYKDDIHFSAINTVTGPYLPLEYDSSRDIDEQIEETRAGNPYLGTIMTEDEAKHAKSKSILNGMITPARLKANEAFMYRLADRIIDEFIDKGTFNVLTDFGSPFAQLTVADLLGVPEEDHEAIRGLVAPPNQLPGNLGGHFDMSTNPLARMGMQFYGYIADRRANPRNDVLTLMAQQTFEDGTLPEIVDIVGLATFLFGAGQDTTVQLFAAMLRRLSDEEGLADRLRAEPNKIGDFVDENLRLEGTSKSTFRYVRKPVNIAGFDFEPGQHVMIHTLAMNRDPRRFENPAAFDIDRKNGRTHVAFGRGLHACAGAPLARAEGRVAIERLLARMENIRISDERHGPKGARRFEHLPNYSLYGVTEQWMDFDPA